MPEALDRRPATGSGPWLAFAFCCLTWGSTFLFIAIGNDTLAPVWAGSLRLGVSAVLLTLMAFVLRRPWPRGRELSAALWFGFVNFGLSLPLLYWGQRTVSSSAAGIVFATIPLTTLGFARMAGLERLSRMKVLAAIAGLAGVALLSVGRSGEGSGALALGAVAGAICYAGCTELKNRFGYDDSLDVFGVHGIGGIIGAIGTGIVASPALGGTGVFDYAAGAIAEYSIGAQVLIQTKAVLVTLLWSGIGSAVLFKLADITIGLRADQDEEREGLDLSYHGERAYNV